MSTPSLVVRKLGSDEEVHRVKINNLSERHVEKVMMGMLRQMNTEEYYIDDSEVDRAREAESGKSD